MASNAFSGVGTEFQVADGSSAGSFTKLAEVTAINGPNKSRNMIKVTNLDSPGGYDEFIAGFRDGGEVSLDMNFTMATYNTMNDQYESDASYTYQIVLGDTGSTTFQFTAWTIGLGMAVPTDDKVSSNVTLKITGQITFST